jgi:hypothetical protein
MSSKPTLPRRQDAAAPGLLLTFLAATLTMVGAVVVIGRTDSDWADAGAVVLMLVIVALLMAAIRRQLRDDEPNPADEESPGPAPGAGR